MRCWLVVLALPLCLGCAGRRGLVSDAFPDASVAAPWVLEDRVWMGTFEAALPAFGRDAAQWRELAPVRAWLATYRHETDPDKHLIVRCLSFASAEEARRACAALRPPEARDLRLGEEGYWTGVGVLFRCGRLIVDVFGADPSWSGELQAMYLASVIAKRLPAGVPADPQ